jgi:hypothetical protein
MRAQENNRAPAFFELRYFRLRNGKQVERTMEYLGRGWLPASQRSGVGPNGFFNALVAHGNPFVLTVTSFPTYLQSPNSGAN